MCTRPSILVAEATSYCENSYSNDLSTIFRSTRSGKCALQLFSCPARSGSVQLLPLLDLSESSLGFGIVGASAEYCDKLSPLRVQARRSLDTCESKEQDTDSNYE